VLFLADSGSGDSDVTAVSQALTNAGLQPTVVASGTVAFPVATLQASTFGAILVSPGRTGTVDMASDSQAAIVAANAEKGTGVVFTEWSGNEVLLGHYSQLAPLLLVRPTGNSEGGLTFTLTVDSHPLWTGLATSFGARNLAYSVGTVINGGTPIATLSGGSAQLTGPGVAVRESQATGGRLVHIAHAASDTPGWVREAEPLKLLTNSLRWAAQCL
jgi:hypothetical protein